MSVTDPCQCVTVRPVAPTAALVAGFPWSRPADDQRDQRQQCQAIPRVLDAWCSGPLPTSVRSALGAAFFLHLSGGSVRFCAGCWLSLAASLECFGAGGVWKRPGRCGCALGRWVCSVRGGALVRRRSLGASVRWLTEEAIGAMVSRVSAVLGRLAVFCRRGCRRFGRGLGAVWAVLSSRGSVCGRIQPSARS